MEPVSLTLGAIVTALVIKAAEKGGETIADGAGGALARFTARLRERFTSHDDQDVVGALELVQAAPDSPSAQTKLASLLDERAEDPIIRRDLDQLVSDAKQAGVSISVDALTIADSPGAVQVVGSSGVSVTTHTSRGNRP